MCSYVLCSGADEMNEFELGRCFGGRREDFEGTEDGGFAEELWRGLRSANGYIR